MTSSAARGGRSSGGSETSCPKVGQSAKSRLVFAENFFRVFNIIFNIFKLSEIEFHTHFCVMHSVKYTTQQFCVSFILNLVGSCYMCIHIRKG